MDKFEIQEKIIECLKTGKFKYGEKLPSENELAVAFKVPRKRVREAYQILSDKGFLESRQGVGHFIKEARESIAVPLNGNESFSEKMLKQGLNYISKTIHCKPVAKDPFGILSGNIYEVARLRIIDDEPVAIHRSYVSEEIFPEITKEWQEITSMFKYYRSKGYDGFTSSSSLLQVDFPNEFERDMLKCQRLVPLIQIKMNCIHRESAKVLETTRITYRGDLISYRIK